MTYRKEILARIDSTCSLKHQLESELSCYTFLMRKPIALALQKVLGDISIFATKLINLPSSQYVELGTDDVTISRSMRDFGHRSRPLNGQCLEELQSSDPPNRTWALNTVHSMLKNSAAFPVIDVPSLTHILISSSLADPESYVHLAAIPVLVTMAVHAPKPVVGILVDAFVDVDERSLKLARGKQTEEKERGLKNALDLRLRVGEVLNTFTGGYGFWHSHGAGVWA